MGQVARNATDGIDGSLTGKRYLIKDRDPRFTKEFRAILEAAGLEVLRTPPRSPNLNAYAERFVRSIKEECLGRMIFFSERQLRTAVWTEKYWDMELEELRARDGKIQDEVKSLVKEGKLDKANEKAALEKRRAESFTERDRKILTDGASNAEYHYLGSAKILGGIGKAFAETLGGMAGGKGS